MDPDENSKSIRFGFADEIPVSLNVGSGAIQFTVYLSFRFQLSMKRTILFIILIGLFISCRQNVDNGKSQDSIAPEEDEMVLAPGKSEMRLLTDRPPNLETPLRYFLLDYTPNDVFFVRWHMANLPPEIGADTFRLRINGHVSKHLELSLLDLKTKFKQFTISALAQCAGNSRSFNDPRVPGGQWKNGAMGNAKWTGVKLLDVLKMAGLKNGAVDVSFDGIDDPPLPGTPDFVKSLRVEKAMDPEIMIAYEMNGEPLPLLNGFPLKLIVPGWYATYWVGMLNEITVHADTFSGFWMKKSYLIPQNNRDANEHRDSLSQDMEPISKMNVRSLFVTPEPDSVIYSGRNYEIQGLAFDGGDGIQKVELSVDNGKSWKVAQLDPEISKYSWRRWRYSWKPDVPGNYSFKVRATTVSGETQPEHHWNRSGYMRNEIEELKLEVK